MPLSTQVYKWVSAKDNQGKEVSLQYIPEVISLKSFLDVVRSSSKDVTARDA